MGSRITSIVSVCLVLVLLGLSAMTGICARALGDDLRGGLGFTVIMEADADTTLVRDVAEMLAADRAVREVKMLSADSILASERALLGSDFALEPGVNPYSAEIEVKMKPEHAAADSVAAMSQYYSQCEGVARVATQGEVLGGVEHAVPDEHCAADSCRRAPAGICGADKQHCESERLQSPLSHSYDETCRRHSGLHPPPVCPLRSHQRPHSLRCGMCACVHGKDIRRRSGYYCGTGTVVASDGRYVRCSCGSRRAAGRSNLIFCHEPLSCRKLRRDVP